MEKQRMRITSLTVWLVVAVFLLEGSPTTAAGRVIYVDGDATGANNGSSWADAYQYLQHALAAASSGDEIWVAQGVYRPAGPGGSRHATFQLKSGVAITGGYAGYGEADPDARDFDAYETILSGDLNGDDVAVVYLLDLLYHPTRAENSYHVVTGSGTDETTVLDGFTVTGGNASDEWPSADGHGGGMDNTGGSPTVANCTFTGNSAMICGGGMENSDYSSPTLVNCTFRGNLSASSGGAMKNSSSSPTLTNCIFTGNWAYLGGGMRNYRSSLTLANCTFSSNLATAYGGGMFSEIFSNLTLTSCVFIGNTAELGGGMENEGPSSLTLTNCVFRDNSAAMLGGGMDNVGDCNVTVTNCIFIGNAALSGGAICSYSRNTLKLANCTFAGNSGANGDALACDSRDQLYPSEVEVANCIFWNGGDEIWNNDSSAIVITYSDVEGGWPGQGNIDADPCFAAPGYWDPNGTGSEPNDDFWVDGDYHLKSAAGRWEPSSQSWVRDEATSPCIDAGNPGCPVGDEPDPNGNRINMGAYGGTAEASKSPGSWRSIADLTNDWIVDYNDLGVFVGYWLESGECIPSDLDRSELVDFADFGIFDLEWREQRR